LLAPCAAKAGASTLQMIRYNKRGSPRCLCASGRLLRHVFWMKCFQTSFKVACVSALLGGCLQALKMRGVVQPSTLEDSVGADGYSSFVWVLGTLLVFRTSHSLARFWDGVTLVHGMMGHWLEMVHVLVAFTRHSQAGTERIRMFKHTLIRLVSFLNSIILADLEGVEEDGAQEALHFELLDIEALEHAALSHIELSPQLREMPVLVFQWLNNLIVDEITSGVLNIPAPLLTRVFHSMNNAMLSYHDAKKYGSTPFPFPYSVAIEVMMCAHLLYTPLVVSTWTSNIAGSVIFTFLLVFLMWVLHLVPFELENPFRPNVNGLDTEDLQEVMNQTLASVLNSSMDYCPRLKKHLNAKAADERLWNDKTLGSLRVAYPAERNLKSFSDVFRTTRRETQRSESSEASSRSETVYGNSVKSASCPRSLPEEPRASVSLDVHVPEKTPLPPHSWRRQTHNSSQARVSLISSDGHALSSGPQLPVWGRQRHKSSFDGTSELWHSTGTLTDDSSRFPPQVVKERPGDTRDDAFSGPPEGSPRTPKMLHSTVSR